MLRRTSKFASRECLCQSSRRNSGTERLKVFRSTGNLGDGHALSLGDGGGRSSQEKGGGAGEKGLEVHGRSSFFDLRLQVRGFLFYVQFGYVVSRDEAFESGEKTSLL